MCASARGRQLDTQRSVGPQGGPPCDHSWGAGCCRASLENSQKDELVAGSGGDLGAPPYINSNREITGKNSHCSSKTHMTASKQILIRTQKGTYRNDAGHLGRGTPHAGRGWSGARSCPPSILICSLHSFY